MAVIVRVFLMKAQNSTDPCVGAALLLESEPSQEDLLCSSAEEEGIFWIVCAG